MKKTGLVALAAAVLLNGCSTAQVRTHEFGQADANGDGRVVLVEWLRFGGAEASFIAADNDRKGYLEEAQFRQAVRFNDEATGGSARQQKSLDDQIVTDVRRSLEQSRDVNAWNIKAEVFQGNVTLSGAVRTQREKQSAEQTASAVQGVKAVFNQLIIKQ